MMAKAKSKCTKKVNSIKSRRGSYGFGNVSRLHCGNKQNNYCSSSDNKLEFKKDISSEEICEKLASKKLIIIIMIMVIILILIIMLILIFIRIEMRMWQHQK